MRLIDADEAEKYLYEHLDDLHMIAAQNAIDEMPTIDAQPVKRGKWRKRMSTPDSVKCCLCGYASIQESPYCGGCGAFMRGDADEPH